MVGAAAAVFPEREKFSCIALLWLALATAGPLAVLYHCWLATHPQTKGPERSLIYFGAIASLSIGAYSERVRTQNEEDYYADLITQSHRNAEIAKNKYARLRAATTWLLASIPVWAIALYLQYKG